MDDLIVIGSEDSDSSIVEVEVPTKIQPPVIDIDDDDILINLERKSRPLLMAKDIIDSESRSETNDNVPESLQLSSPDHWTSDMIKFYNDDWGDEEQFVVEKIQEKMDKTPSLWEVSRKDILFMRNKMGKSRVKCWNCLQYGHLANFCPDPPHVPKCHMCGTPGHLEDSCPNSICLNCGNPSREYLNVCHKCKKETSQKCSRCQARGHNFINCSDHWRLFHLTTGTTSVKIPNKNIYKPPEDMWCCNCGRRGHLRTQCLGRKDFGGFMDMFPYVASYSKAFNDNSHQVKSNGIPWKIQRSSKKEAAIGMNPKNKISRKDKSLKKKLKKFQRNNKRRKGRKGDNFFYR